MVLASHIQTAIDLARQYGVKRLFLFGSALHSPETARDLDLACEGPVWVESLRISGGHGRESQYPFGFNPTQSGLSFDTKN